MSCPGILAIEFFTPSRTPGRSATISGFSLIAAVGLLTGLAIPAGTDRAVSPPPGTFANPVVRDGADLYSILSRLLPCS